MNVALIHPHVGYKGGLETRLWNYITWLRAHQHEVTIFCYKVDSNVVIPEGVKLHRFNFSRVPKPVRMFLFNRYLGKQRICEQFDFSLSLGRTAHQSDLLCPGLHMGFIRAMGRKWPSPVDLQNVWLDNRALSRSKRIWAASGMIRDEIAHYHKVSPEKVHVLYPPLDTTKFNDRLRDRRMEFRRKFGFTDDERVALFVSTAHMRKGLPLLEKVWRGFSNEGFILAVAGHPSNLNQPAIRDLGYIKDSQELYAAADLLVHPARYEPFGQVVSEALACGTPVIVSDRVGAKEILEEPWGMTLPYNDVELWSSVIQKTLAHPPSVPQNIIEQNELSLECHMQHLLGRLA